MYKLLFSILIAFALSFALYGSVSAQVCAPENWCLCGDEPYPACCGSEGPGGYNCGGGGATPAPGGGGGQCNANASVVNCPPGSVKGTTVVSSQCGGRTCNGLGSAQAIGACCRTYTPPRECSDWYCCKYNQYNQCTKNCRDCTDPPTECVSSNLDTYNCIVTCTPTAPSAPTLTSPSNGATVSTTTNNLSWSLNGQTWGAGCPSNDNRYFLYVGPTADSLVLAGTATSASGTSSIPITRSVGTYYWQVRASNGSLTTNSPTWSFTITDAVPWWQVKDGDITTTGDISSTVPSAQLFDIVGLGGFPGVPVYGNTFNLSGDTSKVSTTRWNANTATIQSRLFNYAFFDNLIPNDVNFNDVSTLVSGGTPYTDGYEWYKATGDVSTSGDINIGNRKVILFVENGNFNINGKINVNDGIGFFGVFVEGNISIDPAVIGAPSIEGIYLSDGSFSTGIGTAQLHTRGSVATFGTVNLQRDLTVDTTPAELFEFAPDQMLLFPEKLMFRRTKWIEVAP